MIRFLIVILFIFVGCSTNKTPYEHCLEWQGVWDAKGHQWLDSKCIRVNPVELPH